MAVGTLLGHLAGVGMKLVGKSKAKGILKNALAETIRPIFKDCKNPKAAARKGAEILFGLGTGNLWEVASDLVDLAGYMGFKTPQHTEVIECLKNVFKDITDKPEQKKGSEPFLTEEGELGGYHEDEGEYDLPVTEGGENDTDEEDDDEYDEEDKEAEMAYRQAQSYQNQPQGTVKEPIIERTYRPSNFQDFMTRLRSGKRRTGGGLKRQLGQRQQVPGESAPWD